MFILHFYFILGGVYSCFGNVSYSYLWVTDNTDTTPVTYTGPSGGYALITLPSFVVGSASIVTKDCTVLHQETTSFGIIDSFYSIPQKVNIAGVDAIISIDNIPSDYEVIQDYPDELFLYHKDNVWQSKSLYGSCSDIGKRYYFERRIPSVSLRVDLPNDIPMGNYSGTIPLKLAMATSNADYPSSIRRYSPQEAYPRLSSTKLINYEFNIISNCTIFPNVIELDHGVLSLSTAQGNSKLENITFNCTGPAKGKLSLQVSSTPSIHSYNNALGIDLGNGWDSALSLVRTTTKEEGSQLKFDYSKATSSQTTNTELFSVKSVLQKTTRASTGELAGNAVLMVTFE